MIRNIQLRHAGKYTCAVQTKVDSVSIATDVVVRAVYVIMEASRVRQASPPGPPVELQVTEVTASTVALSWGPGLDHHSAVLGFTIQARTTFSLGWQAVTTVPEVLAGRQLSSTVTELSPWVEYEFRVLATNAMGTGEPSQPSRKVRTKEMRMVTPARVSGGGGGRSELLITWEPVSEEFQSGPGFGYVVAFRPQGAHGWMQAAVKVGVYNNKGEGPFGPVTAIHSAEEEPSRAPGRVRARSVSATEVEVSWKPLAWSNSRRRILGYELRYGERKAKPAAASVVRTAGNASSVLLGHLEGSSTYSISLRAYNSAGFGPPSAVVNVTTKKPRKSAGRLRGGTLGG
ncbi:hypothetical protein CRUP_024984 [Coryphaenoides rupestris]|nr:hypothetical protein CRUP_024984 [Coryphaenoides rupestris]